MGGKPRYVVCAAWPYINYVPHLGTIIPLLSADVVARFLRMRGHEVVFVSGSDEHGTPIEVEAVRQGIDPKELTDRNHELVVKLLAEWELSLDSYIRTEHPVHKEFIKRFYERVYRNGYVFERDEELPYCENCKRFLPDRFVEGTCPYCGYERARGDQCEACGRLLDPARLINPRCAICGSRPVVRRTRHWFLDLTKLQEAVEEYVRSNRRFSDAVRSFSLRMLEEGLRPRSITRDTRWGIEAPFPGAEGKTIYCWFEAVLGYISATIAYFRSKGQPERWEAFWKDPDARSVFFIGKDNIPFHSVLLPALLLASGEGYNLPWDVVSNEFLLWEGEKFSKSRRVGIWIDEALKLFPADYWRFVLVSIRPELRDSNFTWEQFLEKVNSDLNDTIGNFVHRTLSFIWRHFGGRVPEPGPTGPEDEEAIVVLEEKFKQATEALEGFRLKSALRA
ncbi:methionine--tRNA ligase, partial [Candidatus Bathyarchaeota archaeon]